jgi:hypothetical protein
MSPQSKREYWEAVHLQYKNATRHEKTAILDEFRATCGCHRKHAIMVLRKFKRVTKPKAKKRGKPTIYHKEEVRIPLKEIWLAANLPCSKRLEVMLPIWLLGYVELLCLLSKTHHERTKRLKKLANAMILLKQFENLNLFLLKENHG